MSNNNQTNGSKAGLSGEQKRQMKKYAVFALMGVICAGCMYMIFAPSAEEKAKSEQTAGFNADVPLPKEEILTGDKRDAYEKEHIQQKQSERMRSLQDFSALLGDNAPKTDDGLALITGDEPKPESKADDGYNVQSRAQSSIQTSTNAYRDMNSMLGSFYETPCEDPEKEALREELEELKMRMDEAANRKNAIDEQMALMEKSFQMAAKYMPTQGTGGTNGTDGTVGTGASERQIAASGTNASGKMAIVPVTQVRERIVSSLQPEMSDKEFIETYSQPRNMGFYTAVAELAKQRKNTIAACIHENQTVMDGESVRLRLLEPMRAGNMLVRKNTLLSGFAKIQGERLQITITSMEYGGSIIPVEMSVYDADGQKGIFIPDTKEINAVKEVAANMGTNAGTSISLSSDAGEQFAADMGRSVIQGVSQFFSKKMREVKVNLKAGYRVFLLPEENINNQHLATK